MTVVTFVRKCQAARNNTRCGHHRVSCFKRITISLNKMLLTDNVSSVDITVSPLDLDARRPLYTKRQMCNRQISWSLEASRLDVIKIVPLWQTSVQRCGRDACQFLKWLARINPNLAASRLTEILQWDVRPINEWRPKYMLYYCSDFGWRQRKAIYL